MTRKGLSLLEILVASAIMIAALVPLWGLMGSSHKQATISADEVRASQISNEIIEQIENSSWYPDQGEISFTPLKNGKVTIGVSKKLEISFGDYPDYLDPKGRLEIENYPTTGVSVGRIIRLILSYNTKEKVGKEIKAYQISTFIPRK
ncbi:MAG: hypothetical protein Kow0029_10200 [Candidatus Rifleibacteriota bacterium]